MIACEVPPACSLLQTLGYCLEFVTILVFHQPWGSDAVHYSGEGITSLIVMDVLKADGLSRCLLCRAWQISLLFLSHSSSSLTLVNMTPHLVHVTKLSQAPALLKVGMSCCGVVSSL